MEFLTSRFSESQIYEYIARVFYNVVFSTYLRSNASEKILIDVLHISGLLIYLELKVKSSFLKRDCKGKMKGGKD